MKRLKCCMGLICPYKPETSVPFLGIGIICCVFSCLLICNNANAQAKNSHVMDSVISLHENFYRDIDQHASKIESKLVSQTDKYLNKLQQQESKLQKLLQHESGSTAMPMLNDSKEFYKKLADQLNSRNVQEAGLAKVYIPRLDSLMTSLQFLEASKISGINNLMKNQKSLEHIMNMQGSIDRVNQVEKLLLERRQSLTAIVQKAGLFKKLKQYNRHIADFQAQVNAIHELANHTDKLIDASLQMLQRIPDFKKFFNKNSMLASYFRLPGNDQPVDPAILEGLQSRASVEKLVQQRFGSAGLTLQKNTITQMAGMETYLQSVNEKANAFSTLKPDQSIPDYKGNTQKVKSFGQRIVYGINLQSVRASGIFPTTTDFGMQLGYQFSDFFRAGIGASYKIGWGESIQKIAISHQGVGLRTYIESRIKNSFFLSGGVEMNYRNQIREIDQLKNYSAWQKSALLGITKKFKFTNKLKGNMQLLFDFLYARQVPRSQPVLFRIGYGL